MDRIQQLEQQVAQLQSEIVTLRGGKAAPRVTPPPSKEDRPLISYPQPLSIELPDGGQQRKLVEIISGRHSMLTPRFSMKWQDEEEQEFFTGLVTAMRFISTLGRGASVDTTRYLSFWTDQCKDWAKLNDISPIGNIGVSFYLAGIAMGLPYQLGNNAAGILPGLGLRQHGGERITSDGWKAVLGGKLLAPTSPERRFAPPSPAQVFAR